MAWEFALGFFSVLEPRIGLHLDGIPGMDGGALTTPEEGKLDTFLSGAAQLAGKYRFGSLLWHLYVY